MLCQEPVLQGIGLQGLKRCRINRPRGINSPLCEVAGLQLGLDAVPIRPGGNPLLEGCHDGREQLVEVRRGDREIR